MMIVLVDMIVVVCFLIFIWIMEDSQEAYANQFKDESIEMNDFSIRVKGMPHDNQYGCEDSILRAYLIHHFESIIKDEIQKKEAEPKEDKPADDFSQIPKQSSNPNPPVSYDYEIADIEFGKSDMFEIGYLNELSLIR